MNFRRWGGEGQAVQENVEKVFQFKRGMLEELRSILKRAVGRREIVKQGYMFRLKEKKVRLVVRRRRRRGVKMQNQRDLFGCVE